MRIRVGKNIFFKLTVNRLNDEPEDFTDARNVRLTINRKYSSYQVSPHLTIHDNIIEFEFVGGGNATSGQYEIHLYYEKLNEASVTGIDKFYLDFCNAFILVDLTCKEDAGFKSESPSINLKGIIERNRDGKDGVTPRIDPETKHWMIGIEDTGVVAEGKDGLTPFIGENGNWWIGDVDTGKPSRGKAFEYSDFTEEEIHELQEPARAMIDALDTLDKAVTANEKLRIENEVTRVSSENDREESENLRREAENTRVSNEEARETAETGRASAEDNRVKAEQSRVEAENNRVTAENTRVEKENERQTAENTRDTNEQSRKEAEKNRVKAEEGRVTEFNRLKSESETATLNATAQADYAKQQGDNVAGTVNEIKTAQSGLLSRVNDYMYDMSGLLGKLAVKGAVGADEKQVTDGSYYDVNGNLVPSTSGGYTYQKLTVDPSKVYELNILFTGGNVSTLVLFDENDNVIHNSPRVAVSGNFVFTGITSIGITFDKNNESKYVIRSFDIQDLTTVLNTKQGNRALYVAAGAKYNEQTGFYELNGLTDITEEQMREIYVQTHHVTRQTSFGASLANTNSIRTNYPLKVVGGYRQIDTYAMFAGCVSLEVAALGIGVNSIIYSSDISYLFSDCKKLKKVIGIIRMDYASSSLKYEKIFYQCFALVSVNLRGVKHDISFSDSPNISINSLQFLITSASNTSPITVTVHADVYAKIQDEGQVDWHALIETAAAKQITFATA